MRDRQYAFVGSQSLRPLELNSRREIGVIFRNRTIVSSLARLFEDDWEASKPEEEAKARRIPVGKTARKMARVVSENLPVTPVVRQVVKAIQKKTALETPPAQLEKTVRAALRDVVEDTVKEAAKEAIKTMVDAPDLEDVGAK